MSMTASDAFLSGQGIPVEPGRVEDELARLWGPAAERVGGPDLESPHVTRVVLANLVVEACEGSAGRVAAAIDDVVARFPSRAIVLDRAGGGPGGGVAAEVAALCHLPAPGLPQVCSERIVLRAGADSLGLLPGAVRPLLEANLPVVLWWTGDPRPCERLFRALARDATRVVVDLPDPGADPGALAFGLDPAVHPYARDSAWFAVAAWRELVAQFFDGPDGPAALGRIRSVAVEAATPDGARTRLAAWLLAWLAGGLGWEAAGPASAGAGAGSVVAKFRARGGGEVDATIAHAADPASAGAMLRAVTIELDGGEGPTSLRLARPDGRPDAIRVEVCSDRACALPRVVHAPGLDGARRVAAALESSRHDPPFRRALPHALRLLGATKG